MKILCLIVSKLKDLSEFTFTSKKCYQELLKDQTTLRPLTIIWPSLSGYHFSTSDFWLRARDEITENFKKDLIWLIALGGIKVRDLMKKGGYINSSKYSSKYVRCAIRQKRFNTVF